jgi:hypothetical protein
MHTDLWTKTVLALIAVFLGLIAVRPFFIGDPVQAGVADFDHVRYLGRFGIGNLSGNLLMDVRSGDIWGYGVGSHGGSTEGEVIYVGRLTQLGQPLVNK